MSIQEIKAQLATMPQSQQDEVVAYLFHLRHAANDASQCQLDQRLNDMAPSHWLSPGEFERRLDEKEKR
jgi:hypothetical protein